MPKKTDQDMIASGVFFTSETACKHGHPAIFRSSTRVCVTCERERSRLHKERIRSKENPTAKAEKASYMAQYMVSYARRPEVIEARKERSRANYKAKRQHFSEKNKAYRKARADLVAFHAAKSRRGKKRATPKWLTDQQKEQMKQFYLLARDCFITSGQRYDVDHIVPLNGKTVCGLHVPWNLQVLPKDINMSKKNKLNQGEENWI